MTLTVGSLFSGIGGLDLGLERAGMRVIWQSEIHPYACRILAKHWPNIPNLGDITRIDWSTVERPDVICAGWPCQPFSYAGVRGGEDDPRHLWPHVLTSLCVLRPDYLIGENVPGHLSLGFDRVLADLASIGFDAEWSLVSACSLGAPHMRQRLFVLAYPTCRDEPLHLSHRVDEKDRDEPRGSRRRTRRDGWLPEPEMGRVAHGVPAGVVRGQLAGLGNAVVPQVAEHIGRMIVRAAA